jgi:hypothetical protein
VTLPENNSHGHDHETIAVEIPVWAMCLGGAFLGALIAWMVSELRWPQPTTVVKPAFLTPDTTLNSKSDAVVSNADKVL